MKALTFHGKRDVRVDEVPDPKIEQPTDAVVRFIEEGDVLGHEPMGIVEEVGSQKKEDRAIKVALKP